MLKNLMRLLLSKFYSKKESEAVGHQAMPSVSVITLSPTTSSTTEWGPVYEGIAPTDGYAAIRFTADSDYCIAAAQTTNVNTFSTPQVKGDVLMASCPVAKGQPFGLYARKAHSIACWFTKTIGGGYKGIERLICRGGAICLKSLLNFSQRSFLPAGKLGSDIKLILYKPPRLSLREEQQTCRATRPFRFSPPLMTVMYLSIFWVLKLKGFQLSVAPSDYGKEELIIFGQRVFCQLKKATRLLFIFDTLRRLIILPLSYSSRVQEVRPNIGLGGVSC